MKNHKLYNCIDDPSRSWLLYWIKAWRADLEVLFGIIVRGSIDKVEAGNALLTEVVRRILAGPAVMHSAVVTFTLLVNNSVHIVFVTKY